MQYRDAMSDEHRDERLADAEVDPAPESALEPVNDPAPGTGSEPKVDPTAREVVRASPELADVAVSLLLALFPDATLYRAEGRLSRLLLAPAPHRPEHEHLRGLLFDLVDRPEWREKHAVAREVTDADGLRLELLTPIPARQYRGGPALVGPFADERSADEWGGDNARSEVSYDTFFTGSAWLCDLFELTDQR